MLIGITSALSKFRKTSLPFIKDNLKLYLDFKSNKSDTLKFPSEGSTEFVRASSQYIDVGNPDNLKISGALTISVWIKTSTNNQYMWIAGKDGNSTSSQNRNYLIQTMNNGLIQFNAYPSNGASRMNTQSTTNIADGKWHHIVGVYEPSNTFALYVDNVKESELTSGIATGLMTSDIDFAIGRQNNSTPQYYYDGKMANLAVWSRALSPEEIQSIMNKSYSQLKGVEKTSLVAWWALDNVQKVTDNSVSSGLIESETGEILSSNVSSFNSITGTGNNYTNNIIEFVTSGYAFFNISGIAEGKLYRFTYTVLTQTASGMSHSGGSSVFTGGIPTTVGSHEQYLVAGSQNLLVMRSQGFRGTITDIVVQEVSMTGVVTGATTTTSVYGGNAPILPRAVDVAKEGQADAIGDGSLTTSSGGYADLGNDSLIQFGGSFSVSCWFKTTDTTASNEMVIAKADDGVSAGWLIRLNSSRKLDFNYVNSASGGVGVTISDTGSAVNDGEWYHVAFVHESGVGNRAYKNGILIGSNSTGTDLGSHTPNLHVGNQDYSTPRALDGSFAQVGLWQGTLTQAQIQSVMESTSYSKIPADVKSTLGSSEITSASNTTFSGVTSNDWTSSGTTKSFSNDQMVFTMDSGNPAVAAQLSAGNFAGGSGIPQKFLKVTLDVDSTTTGTYRINNAGGSCSANVFEKNPLTTGINTIYGVCDGANSYFRIFGANVSTGDKLVINSFDVKEVTNDIVAYYPLDGSSSRGNGTDDVTTGEVLGNEMVNDTDFTGDGALDNPWRTTQAGWNYNTTENRIEYNDINDGHGAYQFDSQMANSFVAGQLYRAKFTIGGLSSGVAKFRVYDSGLVTTYVDGETTGYGNGTHYAYFVTPSSNISGLVIYGKTTSTSSWHMTEFSIKEVTSNTGVLK